MSHQVFNLELGWNELQKLRDLPDEDYIALRDSLSLIELPAVEKKASVYSQDGWIGTIDDLTALTRFGLPPIVKRVRGIFQEQLSQLGVPPTEGAAAQVVNITIPNAALFSVRNLHVIENECTNYVQTWLDKGWRIVAVCPPNDCRRPTFILGHHETNPEQP